MELITGGTTAFQTLALVDPRALAVTSRSRRKSGKPRE